MYYTQHIHQRQLLTGLKYILHLSVLIIMTLFVFILYQTVFALSPSFPIQGIILHADNWQLNPVSITKNMTECKEGQQHIRFPNIQAVSYYSDGKTLFATLWLSSKFKDIDDKTEQHRSYAFFIVSDSVYNANQSYEVSLDWNFSNPNDTWIKKYHEWSPIPGYGKVLYQENITSNHPARNQMVATA
jgi:hypothetical protein